MQHGVMFLDGEGNILSVNKRFAQELGYSKNQFEPNTIFQVNPHFNFLAWKKLWTELLEKGVVQLETEHLTSTGLSVPVKLRGVLLEGQYCQAIVEGEISGDQEDLYLARFCLDNANEMILWVAADGHIFYANKAVQAMLGYSADELMSMTIADLEPGYNEENWKQEWDELKQKKWLKIEAVRLKKGGEPLPVELSLHYMNYNGREYKLAFMRDLGQQKQLEEIAALSYHALGHSGQMIYWTNSQGRVIYANPTVCAKLGYSDAEILQMHIWELEPGLSENSWKERWEFLKSQGEIELEANRTAKNGELIPVRLYLNYLLHNGKEYNLAFASDLRNKKRLEEDVKLSFETINQSPDMVFWLNEDASFRYFNDTFAKTMGYTRQEIAQMSLLDFFPKHNMADFERAWQVLKSGKILSSEYEIPCKGGSTVMVESLITMIHVEGKQYSSTILRDIRERKANEASLQRQLEEIERLRQQATQENIILKEEIEVGQGFNNIISRSPKYKPVLKQIGQVADTDATVLILGETGTGKELLAKAIHSLSHRAEMPMIKVNCGALPENLIESELFGHEKGSFTGAFQRKLGRFEIAHKGTLFLDEIGELPLDLQSKLLRVLQEGEFERLGGTDTIKVDVRVIAATNRNLEARVEQGEFREDLFYRLNVFPIFNLPLRERKEDIQPLVRHFIEKYNKKLGKSITEIPQPVMDELMEYEYPGNVRELENLIERAVILSPGNKLVSNFQFKKTKSGRKDAFKNMDEMQRQHILEALRRANGKVSGKGGAADLLGMNDKTLDSRMKKLGIGRFDFNGNNG
jgi:PAS domain S-box-containing protein